MSAMSAFRIPPLSPTLKPVSVARAHAVLVRDEEDDAGCALVSRRSVSNPDDRSCGSNEIRHGAFEP